MYGVVWRWLRQNVLRRNAAAPNCPAPKRSRQNGGAKLSCFGQNILMYNFIITPFYCQCGSQGGGISARAFVLARPGVAPPLPAGKGRFASSTYFSVT